MEEYDPFGGYTMPSCRPLTPHEKEKALLAVEWLRKRRIKPADIALLTMRNVDEAGKRVLFETNTKHLTIKRVIKYSGSPLDDYITEVLPCLHVEKFVFVHQAPNGNRDRFVGHVRIDQLTEYFSQKKHKIVLHLPAGKSIIGITVRQVAH